MELRVDKSEILKSLSWTQGVVERRSTMPILANCLLEAKESGLTITATDLEVAVTVEQRAEIGMPGKLTVLARGLYDIVKELPEERVVIKSLPNNWVEITSGKARFKMVGLSAEEFPNLPVSEKGSSQNISAQSISEMIRKVSYAISTDETRFNLNGVFVEVVNSRTCGVEGEAPRALPVEGGRAPSSDGAPGRMTGRAPVIEGETQTLRFAATDSHRLSYAETALVGKWRLPKGVIIPRKGIQELRRLLEGTEGDVSLQIGQKHVVAKRDNISLLIRLVDGQFPPYQQVIPKDHDKPIGIGRNIFTAALRRAQLVTTDRSRGVTFTFSTGRVAIAASNPDIGEVEEEVPAKYKGEVFKWAVNTKYLLDVMGVISDEEVILELKSEVSPCIIRSEFDKGFLSVIMPMRI